MKLSLFELVTIQAALECKLEQLADNFGRIKRYPQKGAGLVLKQLKAKIEKEIDSRPETKEMTMDEILQGIEESKQSQADDIAGNSGLTASEMEEKLTNL